MAESVLLSDAVDEFLRGRASQAYSDQTVRSAKAILRGFLAETGNVYVKSITVHHVERWLAAINERGLAPGSVNLHLNHMSSFFRWARQRRYANRDFDPLAGIRRRKIPPRSMLRIPSHRFSDVLDAAVHPRDRMLIAFGLYQFLRISETSAIRWRDIDLDHDEVVVTITKTTDADRMPICLELRQEILRYRDWVLRTHGRVEPHWYVVSAKDPVYRFGATFSAPEGTSRLRPEKPIVSAWGIVARVLRRSGFTVQPGEGTHTLRRSGARALFDQLRDQGHDGALQRVRAMLHHSSSSVTEHYLGIHVERRQRDDLVRGKILFPQPSRDNVVAIGGAHGRAGDRDV